MLSRRTVLVSAMASAAVLSSQPAAAQRGRRFDAAPKLRALETGQARLGVCLLDTVTGEFSGTRLDERFALCSTFKLALAALCLYKAERGVFSLKEIVPYTKSDLVSWAPVTTQRLAEGGMTVLDLAQATQETSDNTAANLLIRRLGGPGVVTAGFREMGDAVTRLDRYEPEMNLVLSADLRDTTSPHAFSELTRRITTGDVLGSTSRELLLGWMFNTRTGTARLRAGIPSDWRTGNKTGTGLAPGLTNKCNDVAISFPPAGGHPVVVASFYDSGEYSDVIEDRHEAVLADVGRIAAEWAAS
ncbi:MAG: class A beta-lactamase [Planctomycetota bacterium]